LSDGGLEACDFVNVDDTEEYFTFISVADAAAAPRSFFFLQYQPKK